MLGAGWCTASRSRTCAISSTPLRLKAEGGPGLGFPKVHGRPDRPTANPSVAVQPHATPDDGTELILEPVVRLSSARLRRRPKTKIRHMPRTQRMVNMEG